jgi:single-stranded DNA-binding protein
MFTITASGNLGKNPAVKNIGEDKVVCEFPMAVKHNGKTTWVTVEHWGKVGLSHAEHIKCGDKVLVTGTPQATAWIDKDGQARSKLTITADSVEYC